MFRRSRGVLLCVPLLLGLGLVGCGVPRVVSTALKGNLAELGVEIRVARARGELDAKLTRELALAVAERAVASARDPGGPSLFEEPGACRQKLVDAYLQRARGKDASAAAATTALFEEGFLDGEGLVRSYRASKDPTWLAVAARAATSPELAGWRTTLMQHPDARVRRAALRATLAARSPDNLDELLAASRVDPDPQSRRLAIHALGALGTQRAMTALQDRWRAGSTAVRLAVIEAWASTPAYSSGGREALERAALEKGKPAASATVALLRTRERAPGWAKDVLARMLREGTEAEQLLLIAAADTTHERTVNALVAVCGGASEAVRLAAQRALLRSSKHAAMARAQLLEIAKKSGDMAPTARAYLAQAGELRVVPLLEKQLSSQHARERVSAALALTSLALPHKAASALTENSPRARLDVACAMVTASERVGREYSTASAPRDASRPRPE